MIQPILYVLFVGVLFGVQWKLMKKSVQTRDYVTVVLLFALCAAVGVSLALGLQLTSPTMLLQQWLSSLVK